MKEYSQMSYIELIDWVLKWYVRDSNSHPYAGIEELFRDLNEINNNRLVNWRGNVTYELQKVLNKLEKDGYLESPGNSTYINENGNEIGSKQYTNTTEGERFLELGGYTAANLQAAQLELDRQTQKELAKSAYNSQRVMVYLTGVLALGTVVSAVYYLFEIHYRLKQNHPHFYAKFFPLIMSLELSALGTSIIIGIYYMMKVKDK